MSARYVVGQPAVLTCTFTVNGLATDPTTISLVVTDPSGAATTYTFAGSTITRSAQGVYTKTVTAPLVGVWSFVWTGTGAAADIQDGTFTVFPVVPIATLYATLDEVKDWLQIPDARDDAALQRIIASVSRWIDAYTDRQFWLDSPRARTYEAVSRYSLTIDDVGDQTGFVVKTDASGDGTFETTWSASDWQLLPVNAPQDGPEPAPWYEIRAVGTQTFPLAYGGLLARRDRVQVTARWGWPQVPDDVKQACIMQAARVFKRKESPGGVLGDSNFGVVRVTNRLDADVEQMLAGYRSGNTVAVIA